MEKNGKSRRWIIKSEINILLYVKHQKTTYKKMYIMVTSLYTASYVKKIMYS